MSRCNLAPGFLCRLKQLPLPMRLLTWLAIPAIAIVASLAVSSQPAPPAITPIALASGPLYAATSGDKATMALALSVEWPTAGAQYFSSNPNSATDNSYSNTNEYIGYYDAESCYAYNDAPTETLSSGETRADYKRFDRVGRATNRMCADAFSGNFLNWSSSSAIDMLRLALSGGDRLIDRDGFTVLQRAVLPCLWNTSSFPAKRLTRNPGEANTFWGAVPLSMRTAAGSNDIWVSNALNQIFFHTSYTAGDASNCSSAGIYTGRGAYTLGSNMPTVIGTSVRQDVTLPSDAVLCAEQDQVCTVTSVTKEAWYGTGNRWMVTPVSASFACTHVSFGDPAVGDVKSCYIRNYTGTWKPNGAAKFNAVGPVTARTQALPSDVASPACATTEGALCTFSGLKEVWYGVDTRWRVAPAYGSVLCSAASVFGDPAGGVLKACYVREYTGNWQPQYTGTATAMGAVEIKTDQALPGDASPACATEGQTCTFTGIREVWYGVGSKWAVAVASNSVLCSHTVFTDPYYGQYKACYTRPYTGAWSGALNSDGYFYSRVKVCDQSPDGTLLDVRDYGVGRDFCSQYPNNKFKPTGTIQKYGNQFRLAAFGYAIDQTQSANGGRYGGVLRAPMKFVGAKTFDVNGQDNTPAAGNPGAEWDPITGVFKANPDGDTTQTPPVSGVINYLNKFGRTGPTPGRYKTWDPVGELYYETLRYLQGLPPTSDAVKNLTPAMYDGFPIFTDWTAHDPFANRSSTGNYSCLRNNIVVIGDIETHDSPNYGRFPAPDDAGNVPNFAPWRNTVAAFEKGTRVEYLDGQGVKRETGNPNTPNSYNFGDQFGIAGTAYWAHTHDIRGTGWTKAPTKQRPGLRAKTFLFDVNAYARQNDTQQRRYKNQFFMAAKYGGFETMPSAVNRNQPYNTWGNPFKDIGSDANGVTNNDVWQDPENPGEAATYARQSSARSVLRSFDKIFTSAGQPIRSIAGAAARTSTLTQQGNTLYQAEFSSSDWSGDLAAYAVSTTSSSGQVNVSVSDIPTWSAGERLKNRTDINSRNIVIGKPGTTAPQASAFTWDAISVDLRDQLHKPDPSSPSDNNGQARLNFIRGDHSNEITLFRNRDGQRLGDIVNSGVAYSGAPADGLLSTTYAGFRADQANRRHAVFVGANDGMLHAFDAGTGDELFGYIPSWMGPKLSALTSKNYVGNHQSYVDATPVVAEAQVGSEGTSTDWKTVLVGGTGAGGRGVYALDVTDPTAFSTSKVMWEFTPADDIDSRDSNHSLGYVVGRPQILKFRTSAATAASPTYKWFAVVASGVNNYVSDGSGRFSTTGKPALYLLDLAKPQGTAWTLGTNYFKVSIPINASLNATHAAGALNFKVTLGTQQEVTQLFVGDLHGQLWKLNFKPWGSTDWNMNQLSAFSSNGEPYPLYIAKDATGNVQPISAAPLLIRGEGRDSIYVAFGTGKYLEALDRSSTASSTFYVVHDNGTNTADSAATPPASVISGRGRLQAGSFNSTTGGVDVPAFLWGRATSDSDTGQRSGWFIDLATSGERQVTGALLQNNILIFSTLIPDAASAANTCGAAGGTGREYRLNVDTGDGTSTASMVGLLGASMAMDIETATVSTTTDSTGRRRRTIKTQTISQGSTGLASTNVVTTEQIAGRLSWRQIHNYRELRK